MPFSDQHSAAYPSPCSHLKELHFPVQVAPLLPLLGECFVNLLGTIQLKLLIRLQKEHLWKR